MVVDIDLFIGRLSYNSVMFYLDFFCVLDYYCVEYVLIGGLVVVLYGVECNIMDIDISVVMFLENL